MPYVHRDFSRYEKTQLIRTKGRICNIKEKSTDINNDKYNINNINNNDNTFSFL